MFRVGQRVGSYFPEDRRRKVGVVLEERDPEYFVQWDGEPTRPEWIDRYDLAPAEWEPL